MTDIPQDVAAFLDTVENKTSRADSETLLALYTRATGHPPCPLGQHDRV